MPETIIPSNSLRLRQIRSFVRREGRMTRAQNRAWETLLPKYHIDPARESRDFAAIFGRNVKRTLEIGFGSGEILAGLARIHPDEDFIGIEVYRPGIGRLLLALDEQLSANVRVICADAADALTQFVPDTSLDAVLLCFPDPWNKKRHHKRRLLQTEFVALVAAKLNSGGHFQLATDCPDYAEHMLSVLSESPDFVNAAFGGGYASRPAAWLPSKFERRGLRLGHTVHHLDFFKR